MKKKRPLADIKNAKKAFIDGADSDLEILIERILGEDFLKLFRQEPTGYGVDSDLEILIDQILGEDFLKPFRQEPTGADPYLQPGQICEVWDDGPPNEGSVAIKHLQYFAEISYGRLRFFTDHKDGNKGIYQWEHYRPIGTEWDHAKEDVDRINIGSNGCFTWRGTMTTYHSFGGEMKHETILEAKMKTILPKEYYGQTIQRPEWAK